MEPLHAKAKLFEKANTPFSDFEIILPKPEDHEVLVKITYTTICTSDLHTYSGRRNAPAPSILGHEIIGKIEKTGKKIRTDFNGEEISEGDLITWSVYAHDPNNEMAQKGIPQKSPDLFKYGHQSINHDSPLSGGFATHCLLKEGTALFKLPQNLTPQEAAPINCAHATIAGALRLAGDLPEKNILIFGAGMLGLSASAMARENNASKVIVADVNDNRLDFAKQFGADKTLNTLNATEKEIKNILGPANTIDVVIDTTGNPAAMELGTELLTVGGIAVWVGAVYSTQKTRLDAETIVRNLLTLKGLHNYTPNDLAFAVEFMKQNHNKYPFIKLVGLDFPLEELDQAIKEANTGKYYRIGINQNS